MDQSIHLKFQARRSEKRTLYHAIWLGSVHLRILFINVSPNTLARIGRNAEMHGPTAYECAVRDPIHRKGAQTVLSPLYFQFLS